MKKRAFLTPLAVSLAALLTPAVGATKPVIEQTKLERSIEPQTTKLLPMDDFVLTPAEPAEVQYARHRSHASHVSHASHSSHQSHYSGS